MANLIGDLLNGVMGQPQPQTSKQDDSLPTSMSDNRLAESISYVNTHGGNPEQAFYQLCKEKHVTPMDAFNELKRRMGMR